jgi:subtilisin family serine protease
LKKTAIVLMLAVLALAMFPTATSGDATSLDLSFDAMMYRAELESEIDADSMIASESLSEATPFWVDMVDADLVDNDGEGVYVAVLDTGLLEMWPWLFGEANIAWELGKGFTHDIWWDDGFWMGPLRDDRGFITKAFEGSGHGTHVVSTIVGYNYWDLLWVRGVAPKATIIPVLVLDAWAVPYPGGVEYFSGGTDPMVAAGIYYVADLAKTLDGPVIISMSLGGPSPSPMIEGAINYAIEEGVIVVASAGNEGYAGMGWPGAYPQVISCAMAGWTEQWVGYPDRWWLYDVNEKLNSADYWGNNWHLFLDYLSSRPNKDLGQKASDLDVTTPGAAIVGPYKPYFSDAIGYYYLWGTSMAAPHVSGTAALVLQSYPYNNQQCMEHILKVAAAGLPLPSDGSLAYDFPGWPYYFEWFGPDWGRGFLQADNALFNARIGKGSSKGAFVP